MVDTVSQKVTRLLQGRCALVAVLVLFGGLGAVEGTVRVDGQEATATTTPAIPGPDECMVEPRPLPLLAETSETAAPVANPPTPAPSPTPIDLPEGDLVDEETAEAVNATVRESIACRNAGDFRRAYALFTDRYLRGLLGPPDQLDPAIVRLLEAPPTPLPVAARLALVEVYNVRRLADGRVGAVVVTQDARAAYADYLFFVEADRWLIDERVFLSDLDLTTPEA